MRPNTIVKIKSKIQAFADQRHHQGFLVKRRPEMSITLPFRLRDKGKKESDIQL